VKMTPIGDGTYHHVCKCGWTYTGYPEPFCFRCHSRVEASVVVNGETLHYADSIDAAKTWAQDHGVFRCEIHMIGKVGDFFKEPC
jgi:hypothetical protein